MLSVYHIYYVVRVAVSGQTIKFWMDNQIHIQIKGPHSFPHACDADSYVRTNKGFQLSYFWTFTSSPVTSASYMLWLFALVGLGAVDEPIFHK